VSGPILKIGTRGSPMALAQTGLVRDRLAAAHLELAVPGAIEIVVVRTTADAVQDRPLAAIGGKGLFTKELEEALFDRRIDIAVHSLKDVPAFLPGGLVIGCVLPRDDPRDAFLAPHHASLAALPPGATVGTSSPRRQAQILNRRPDLRVVPLRGNANTRLRKLQEGACDATLLAIAGLRRIGMAGEARAILSPVEMLPALAQGALGIECRVDEGRVRDWLRPLACPVSTACIDAERGVAAALEGTCRTPVAGLAEAADGRITLRALAAMPDGTGLVEVRREGALAEARRIGEDAGAELRGRMPAEFFL
jgi:hydroxymethylbilane synthase